MREKAKSFLSIFISKKKRRIKIADAWSRQICAHKHNIDDDDNVDYLECGHQSIYWITCEFVVVKAPRKGNNKKILLKFLFMRNR